MGSDVMKTIQKILMEHMQSETESQKKLLQLEKEGKIITELWG